MKVFRYAQKKIVVDTSKTNIRDEGAINFKISEIMNWLLNQ